MLTSINLIEFKNFIIIANYLNSSDFILTASYFAFKGKQLIIYVQEKYITYHWNFTLNEEIQEKIMLEVDLPKFLQLLKKYELKSRDIMSLRFSSNKLTISVLEKTGKTTLSVKEVTDIEDIEDIKNKFNVFHNRYFLNNKGKKLNDLDNFEESFHTLKSIIETNATDKNAIKLKGNLIQYGDRFCIINIKNKENIFENDEGFEAKIHKITLGFLATLITNFDDLNIYINDTDKFLFIDGENFKAIMAQHPIKFDYPEDDEIAMIAPMKGDEESYSFVFQAEALKKEANKFKQIFSENAWRYEPISIEMDPKNQSTVRLFYEDFSAKVEQDIFQVESLKCTDNYIFTYSNQAIKSFLDFMDKKEVTLTVLPVSETKQIEKCKGFTLSDDEGNFGVFIKMEK